MVAPRRAKKGGAPFFSSGELLMRLFLLFLSFVTILGISNSAAGTIEQGSFLSLVVKKTIFYEVLLPQSYAQEKAAGQRFPVVYMLHCSNGSADDMAHSFHIMDYLDNFHMIIVLPDDGRDFESWWLDSPILTDSKFSTFLATEFKRRIDSLYPTLPDRANTGVAGHSMGGYGAFHNLLCHPEIYSIAFSAKGVMDLPGNRGKYFASDVLGPYPADSANYITNDILRNAKKFDSVNAKIGFYSCPLDWFPAENRKLDTVLTKRGVDHWYFEGTDQSHYPMDSVSTRLMLKFFNDHFAANGIKYPVKKNIVMPGLSVDKKSRAFTLNGRILPEAIDPKAGSKVTVSATVKWAIIKEDK
jgi:S-formylglutathione hydrolase FrmB